MISEENYWLILKLTLITTFDWLNDVANLHHNAMAMSASSDKQRLLLTSLTLFIPSSDDAG